MLTKNPHPNPFFHACAERQWLNRFQFNFAHGLFGIFEMASELVEGFVWPVSMRNCAYRIGLGPFFVEGERGPRLTQSRLGRGLAPYQVIS